MDRTRRRDSPSVDPSPPGVLRVFADLALVVLVTAVTVGLAVAYGEQGGPTLLRIPLGVAFVFFVPGYAITAALFPKRRPQPADSRPPRRGWVTPVERVVLSVGLSITVVPLLGLGLTLLTVRIGLLSVMGTIAAVTLSTTAVAALRRRGQPFYDRFYLRFGDGARFVRSYVTESGVNVAVALLLVAVLAGGGLAFLETDNSERYTEFGIVGTGNETGTAAYPTGLPTEGSEPLQVAVVNEEHRPVSYTGVVLVQEVDGDSGEVLRSSELDRFTVRLAHGERAVYEHEPQAPFAGERLRLMYLLYRGEPPAEPAQSGAYRSLYLTVDVAE